MKYVLQGTKVLVVPLVTNASLLKLNLRDNWMEGMGGATMLKENCYFQSPLRGLMRLGGGGAPWLCLDTYIRALFKVVSV